MEFGEWLLRHRMARPDIAGLSLPQSECDVQPLPPQLSGRRTKPLHSFERSRLDQGAEEASENEGMTEHVEKSRNPQRWADERDRRVSQ